MTQQLIQSIKLSAASKKLFAQAVHQRDELLQLSSAIAPDRPGRTSDLHRIADEAVAAFWAAPCRELADAAHDALVRNRDAQVSFDVLNEGIHRTLPKAARIAEAAALQVIDDAVAELNRQHEAAVEGAPRGGIFTTKTQLDNQHEAASQELLGERNAILTGGDPLHWLENHGYSAD